MKRSQHHPSGDSGRRRLLKAAIAVTFGSWSQANGVEITGQAMPKLAAYDELMTDFMQRYKPPGASLAVSYHGRLVYARGFGLANVEHTEPVKPTSLFRIASVSKPFASAAIMHLVERGKLKLDDRVMPMLKLQPHLASGAKLDPRWDEITVLQCLQHTAGFDRDKSFDPISARTAEAVSKALDVPLPIHPKQIIRYMMGRPLDFDPGTTYVYSNFGYCLLGRVVEAVSGQRFGDVVTRQILSPLGIKHMQLAKNAYRDRAPSEVTYYDSKNREGRAVCGPRIGQEVPLPYGVENVENMDANGGWIASTVDLLRFATALDNPKRCLILKEATIRTMLAPPAGDIGHRPNGEPKAVYYACGWQVRPAGAGKYTKWHNGMIGGTSTLLVCRADAIDWAVLFNSDATKDGKQFAGLIDPLLHRPADEIKSWPDVDLFSRF